MNDNVKEFLVLEGYTDDLLMVNGTNSMKMTRLIDLDPESKEYDEEIIDIAVTSTNEYGNHPRFDQLLGKKIRLKVEILE